MSMLVSTVIRTMRSMMLLVEIDFERERMSYVNRKDQRMFHAAKRHDVP